MKNYLKWMCHWHSCAFFVGISCVFTGSFFLLLCLHLVLLLSLSSSPSLVHSLSSLLRECRNKRNEIHCISDGVPTALRQRKEDFLDHQNKNKIIFIWLHVIQKRYVYDSGLQFTIDADVCRKSWNVFDVVILCIRTCAVCEVGMSSLIFCFVRHLLHPEDFPHFFPLKFL